MRLLIQTMGIIARADGKIEDSEIDTISEIHARMFGINLKKEEVEEILSELGSPIEILGSLGRNKSKISPLMKQKIIQACHLVIISDLDIDDKESAQIGAIGLALGFSDTQIKEMVALAEI
ncbi:MAG: TerB family tellurite resistance protein [Rhizobiaceae bacterium]|nr:TerB family tellurite resistance protein [Rhizobiaceae bacterium]